MEKYILFDLDNTLLNFSSSEERALDAIYHNFYFEIPYKKFIDSFKRINRYLWSRLDDGHGNILIPSEIALMRFAEINDYFHVTVNPEIISSQYDAINARHSAWFRGVDRTIEFLHYQGCKLGIITNGPSKMQHLKRQYCQLDNWFRCFTVADEWGVFKPSPLIFHIAKELMLQKESSVIKNEDILVVGDSLKTDGIGAKAADMRFCFVSHGKDINQASNFADVCIESVCDLPEVFGLSDKFSNWSCHFQDSCYNVAYPEENYSIE